MERCKEFFVFCMMLMLIIPASARAGAVPDTGQTVFYDGQGNLIAKTPSTCSNKLCEDAETCETTDLCERTFSVSVTAGDPPKTTTYSTFFAEYTVNGTKTMKQVYAFGKRRCFDENGLETTCGACECYEKSGTSYLKIACPTGNCSDKVTGGATFPCPTYSYAYPPNSTEALAELKTNRGSASDDFYGQDANYTINTRSYTKLAYGGNPADTTATTWPMVKDNKTNLMWEVKQAGTEVDPSQPNRGVNKYVFSTIQTDFIAKLNGNGYGSYKDWRLPTAVELAGLIDCSKSAPAINVDSKTGYFVNMQSGTYWTSTESGTQVYAVDFSDGSLKLVDKTAENHAIAVRTVK